MQRTNCNLQGTLGLGGLAVQRHRGDRDVPEASGATAELKALASPALTSSLKPSLAPLLFISLQSLDHGFTWCPGDLVIPAAPPVHIRYNAKPKNYLKTNRHLVLLSH